MAKVSSAWQGAPRDDGSERGAHGISSGRMIQESDVAGAELQDMIIVWMTMAVDPSTRRTLSC